MMQRSGTSWKVSEFHFVPNSMFKLETVHRRLSSEVVHERRSARSRHLKARAWMTKAMVQCAWLFAGTAFARAPRYRTGMLETTVSERRGGIQ